MKILFIYQFLTTGGVETVLRARIDGLAASGIEAQAWFLKHVDGDRVFEGCAVPPMIGDFTRLQRHLQNVQYDVVSVIDTPEVFSLLERMPRVTDVVLEAHTPYLENLEYLRSLNGLRFSSVLVPSRFQAKLVKQRLQRQAQVKVVPNPLGTNFAGRLESIRPKPAKPVVGWVGRLDSLKNWQLAIRTAAKLRRRLPEFELWLAGRLVEPQAAALLYRMTKREGVLGQLRWFENFPHVHMHRWLDAVRESGGVVLATSNGESFGMGVAEAMARACAVVVPDRQPFDELVTNGQAEQRFRPGSAQGAAKQIERLLADRDLRAECGMLGRERILRRHGLARATERWIEAVVDRATARVRN